eukprot:g3439.t1
MNSCTTCTAGKFSADAGGNPAISEGITCDNCPLGKYDTDSLQSKCNDCALGLAAESTGLTACVGCAIGKYSDGQEYQGGVFGYGATICRDCAAGRHQNHPASHNCSACLTGHAQDQTGQSGCYSCDAGKYAPGRELTSSGTYDGASTHCEDCEAGKYGHNPTQSDCLWCTAGKANPSLGQSECEKCSSGRFSEDRASDCEDCAFYEYATGDENVDCESCFSMKSGIGLAYPSQCVSSWIILVSICVLPCIVIYSYRCYMSGNCNSAALGKAPQMIIMKDEGGYNTTTAMRFRKGVELNDVSSSIDTQNL